MLQHLEKNPNYSPRRIVLLGANGFVGKYLSQELKNHQVLGLSSKELDLTHVESTAWMKNNFSEHDVIVFLSCLTPDRGRDTATLLKNLNMAKHVADYVANNKTAQLIYISSDAVYDTNSNPISEKTSPHATDLYAYMHIGRELILKEACAKSSTPLCILRPVGMFGEGDTHNSYGPNRFLKQATEAKKITLFGEGEEKRDHLHVKDFAHLIKLVIENKSTGLLNAATGKSISFHQVAEAVAKKIPDTKIECLNRSGAITHKHFDIANLIAAFPQMSFKAIE